MAKCPHCGSEIDHFTYQFKEMTGGRFYDTGEYDEKWFENLAEPEFFCPKCDNKICEGHENGVIFLGGKI